MGFSCQKCGYRSPKWLGRCPACDSWHSLVEEPEGKISSKEARKASLLKLSEIPEEEEKRISSGLLEFDRVLGGGLVPSSLVLLGGDPGIGKSTLLLQVLASYERQGKKVAYLSGEESAAQIRLRARRLGIKSDLFLVVENDLRAALAALEDLRPVILAVDSIQTVYLPELSSAPGSVAQVREAAALLLRYAKEKGVAVFLVGHVTKEGILAGPRVLEHLVDVVLYFEGERTGAYRLLRAVKNRFGPLDEIGVFEMTDRGLLPVSNPSTLFLGEGTGAIFPAMEGSRVLLVEIQALVVRSFMATPRRTGVGFDPYRLSMLLAILEKAVGISFYDRDVFLNVVAGLRIREPAGDLAACAALLASRLDRKLPTGTVYLGEVGLSGEIRPVAFLESRLKEAARLGFKKALLPAPSFPVEDFGMELHPLKHIRELKEFLS